MTREFSIQVRQLTRTLGGFAVLRALDFDALPGDCVNIQGKNGSGKSTLLACLAGLLRPDSGSVLVFGRSPADPETRRTTGMVAHESYLFPSLSLRENLIFAGRIYGVEHPRKRADHWLHNAGLQRKARSLPRELSQGMRRRASIARALIHEPRLLILDEPFASLDREGAIWLSDLLSNRLRRGLTTVMVTHQDQPARLAASRHWNLHLGRLYESTATNRSAALPTTPEIRPAHSSCSEARI